MPRHFSMYIVAIAWLYVVLMMSLTEQSWIAGVGTFLLYGVAPLSLFLWIVGSPARKRRRQAREQTAPNAAPNAAAPSGDGTP
jgi:biotin transporter BioY